MGVLEVLAAMALTIGCVGIVMLAAMAANRLYEHQERRDAERRHFLSGPANLESRAAADIENWDNDDIEEDDMGDARGSDRVRRAIAERFAYHPGNAVTGPKHDETRSLHLALALWVLDNVPDSRERSLALTALQESMMWANAAIAIHTEPEPGRRDSA